MKVVLAYNAFEESFRAHFPDMFTLDMSPVAIKESEGRIRDADLVILSGGDDIDPAIYGERNTSSYTNPKRDKQELWALNVAMENPKTKFLGVCRGHQMLNAYFGGKLVQHINPGHPSRHTVESISKASFEEKLFPNGVNSLHHQGVIVPGEGFTPLSRAGGVIEATIAPKAVSVQYHPEFMSRADGQGFFDFVKDWAN